MQSSIIYNFERKFYGKHFNKSFLSGVMVMHGILMVLNGAIKMVAINKNDIPVLPYMFPISFLIPYLLHNLALKKICPKFSYKFV
jgi:hypothetical protein